MKGTIFKYIFLGLCVKISAKLWCVKLTEKCSNFWGIKKMRLTYIHPKSLIISVIFNNKNLHLNRSKRFLIK